MNKKDLIAQLNTLVERMDKFIEEILMPRDDVGQELLAELREVLGGYQEKGDVEILFELREIESKPVSEGAPADYTTGVSLPLDGSYTSVMEQIQEIEDLVVGIRRS